MIMADMCIIKNSMIMADMCIIKNLLNCVSAPRKGRIEYLDVHVRGGIKKFVH